MSHTLRGRRALALVMALMALVGVLAGTPRAAQAATLHKDGFEGVGPTDIHVDTTKLTSGNAQYTLPSGWARENKDNNSDVLYVKMRNSYIGKTQTWPAITIRFPGAGTDYKGDRLDVVMTVEPQIVIGHHEAGITDPRGDLNLSVIRLMDDPGELPWFDGYIFDTSTDKYMGRGSGEPRAPGCKFSTTVRFVRAGTDTLATGSYAMYLEDIDMPDHTTPDISWTGKYNEGVILGDGMSRDVHALPNTLVAVDGDDVHSTHRTETENQRRSAFTTRCEPQFSYMWHASSAGTQMFKPVSYPSGNLTVTKRVSSAASEAAPAFAFTVTFEGTHAPAPMSFSLADGQSRTIGGIPAGVTATVTEDTGADWVASWAPADRVTVSDGGNHVVTCTNTRKAGNLRVRKVATGFGTPAGKTWPFKVTVTNRSGGTWRTETFGLANGAERTVTGIPTGYGYVVEETLGTVDAARWAVGGVPARGTVSTTDTVTVTGSNVRRTGTLEVTKAVDRSRIRDKGLDRDRAFQVVVTLRNEDGAAVTGTFGDMAFTDGSCTLTLRDGEVKRAPGIPTEYSWTVSEPGVPTGYERGEITNSQGTVTEATVRSTVTNRQLPGWARVTKVTG